MGSNKDLVKQIYCKFTSNRAMWVKMEPSLSHSVGGGAGSLRRLYSPHPTKQVMNSKHTRACSILWGCLCAVNWRKYTLQCIFLYILFLKIFLMCTSINLFGSLYVKTCLSWACWQESVISIFGRWRLDNEKLKASLGSLKPWLKQKMKCLKAWERNGYFAKLKYVPF